jgi:hypothetical protein
MSKPNLEVVELDETDNDEWNKVEESLLEFFKEIDISPNDALNILLHTAVHIAVMGGVEKDALIGGLALTYDNTVEGFSVEGEVH